MTNSDDAALLDAFDAVVCDLDGVVYRGRTAIDGAVESLRQVRRGGKGVVYATNNASRPPGAVATQLRGLGLELDDRQVVTSAQAGAQAMRDRLGAGARVLAVGGPGVAQALEQSGLRPVPARGESGGDGAGVEGVLQGFGHEVTWTDLAEAAYAVGEGALWIATNTDATLPTERGVAPGNGTLVAAVGRAAGADPVVVGKPQAPLYRLAIDVIGARPERTLAIGDRIDTDIAGAHAAGLTALLVLTGVDGVVQLTGLAPQDRPRYLLADLTGLHHPYLEPVDEGQGVWTCGEAGIRLTKGDRPALIVLDHGAPGELARAAVTALWHGQDAGLDPSRARALAGTLRTDRRGCGRGQARDGSVSPDRSRVGYANQHRTRGGN